MLEITQIDKYTGTDRSLVDRRFSVRAFIVNEDFEVAVIYSKKHDFYMFTGGGIKEGEDQIPALKREVREEIGLLGMDVLCELGSIEEYLDSKYHDNHVYHLSSYCYLCKKNGDLVEPIYSEKESVNEYEPRWIPFKDILSTFKNNINNDYFRFGLREYELAKAGYKAISDQRCEEGIKHFKEDL